MFKKVIKYIAKLEHREHNHFTQLELPVFLTDIYSSNLSRKYFFSGYPIIVVIAILKLPCFYLISLLDFKSSCLQIAYVLSLIIINLENNINEKC